MVMAKQNRYSKLITEIFFKYYLEGLEEIQFERTDIVEAAEKLKIKLPKNLGDVLYSFRYRVSLPEAITTLAPSGYEWIIRPAGRAKYAFALVTQANIELSPLLAETKVLDATPGVIEKYAQSDEQALLAKIRYNRLIDIFTGLTCYSLQNHLRTYVAGMGQVETDEIYIGVDSRGVHYVLPVQAKGEKDRLGIVQIEQDLAMCAEKYPDLICKPIAAQFMGNQIIAIFELESSDQGVVIVAERHYRLVHPDELSSDELRLYRNRSL